MFITDKIDSYGIALKLSTGVPILSNACPLGLKCFLNLQIAQNLERSSISEMKGRAWAFRDQTHEVMYRSFGSSLMVEGGDLGNLRKALLPAGALRTKRHEYFLELLRCISRHIAGLWSLKQSLGISV